MGKIVKKGIIKTFENYYQTGKTDTIELEYCLPKGMGYLPDVKKIIQKNGFDPELFAYISVDDELCAVSMELLGNQIVLSGEKCYFKSGKWNLHGFSGVEGYVDFSEMSSIPTKINKPRVNQWWTDEVAKDIKELFDIKITRGTLIPESAVSDTHLIILLAKIMFVTKIPVFRLNVMDAYFANSPSRFKLWKNGVYAYNPYTGEEDIRSIQEINKQRKLISEGKWEDQ